MSRHHCLAVDANRRKVFVAAGYDRRLRIFFLQVHRRSTPACDEIAFSSLSQPFADWSDVSAIGKALASRALLVPATLLDEIGEDAKHNAGNRVLEHHADAYPRVLATRPGDSSRAHVVVRARRSLRCDRLSAEPGEILAFVRTSLAPPQCSWWRDDHIEILREGSCDHAFCVAAGFLREPTAAA